MPCIRFAYMVEEYNEYKGETERKPSCFVCAVNRVLGSRTPYRGKIYIDTYESISGCAYCGEPIEDSISI